MHQKRAEAGGLQTKEKQYVPDYLSIAGNELMAYEIGAGGTVIFEPSLKTTGDGNKELPSPNKTEGRYINYALYF